MAYDGGRASILAGLIRDAGVPLDGLAVLSTNPAVQIRLDFPAKATDEQKALAQQIADGFDWRRRVPLDRATVVTALRAVVAKATDDIVLQHLAESLRTNPPLAAQIGQSLGKPLVVDEVDPS